MNDVPSNVQVLLGNDDHHQSWGYTVPQLWAKPKMKVKWSHTSVSGVWKQVQYKIFMFEHVWTIYQPACHPKSACFKPLKPALQFTFGYLGFTWFQWSSAPLSSPGHMFAAPAIGRHVCLQSCSHHRTFGPQGGHWLLLMLGAHQGAIRIIVFQKGDHTHLKVLPGIG